MRKQEIYGYITMESDKQHTFADFTQALKHFQSLLMLLASQGLFITTYIRPTNKTLDVKVFLDGLSQPWLPVDCKYSWKEITSQEFYNDYRKKVQRIRTIIYHFNY